MAERMVFFDLDKTLIDSTKLLENIRQSLVLVGVDATTFDTVLAEYKKPLVSNTEFNPWDFMHLLSQAAPTVAVQQLEEVFWHDTNFSKALFPEAFEVVKTLYQRGPVGTFSQGVPEWQLIKLEKSGLAALMSEKFREIHPNKLTPEVVSRLPEQSVVVDDKVEVIAYLIATAPHVLPVLIDRNGGASNSQKSIRNLTEVFQIIEATNTDNPA